MPKRTDLESILILGSGPIVIGQDSCHRVVPTGPEVSRACRARGVVVSVLASGEEGLDISCPYTPVSRRWPPPLPHN